jgi:nucleotide-binding universal stress UspA family protein
MKTKPARQSRRTRVKPQRILVPVDFSDSSARALRHAAKRAAESKGSLIIVHVVPADYGWLGIGRDESRDVDRSLQRQAADRLRAFVDEQVRDTVAAELQVRIGQPAAEIIGAARESKCESIVLSTCGLTGLDRYLIGSVADRVARLAPCPVLLIRPGKRSLSRREKGSFVLRFEREAKHGRSAK